MKWHFWVFFCYRVWLSFWQCSLFLSHADKRPGFISSSSYVQVNTNGILVCAGESKYFRCHLIQIQSFLVLHLRICILCLRMWVWKDISSLDLCIFNTSPRPALFLSHQVVQGVCWRCRSDARSVQPCTLSLGAAQSRCFRDARSSFSLMEGGQWIPAAPERESCTPFCTHTYIYKYIQAYAKARICF